jgi:DUF971 family protein
MQPRRVVVDREEQILEVHWTDGHTSRYVLDGLRRSCPCASCQGGHENMGQKPDPVVLTLPSLVSWKNLRLEPVGNYAVRFVWDDGHNSGIYSWKWLRDACPCDECVGAATM